MEYIIEEIESIEQLDNFEDEYVYDIEVNDNSHTFIANDILIHNSVYITYGTLFKCMTEKYQNKYATDEAKRDWILRFNKEFLDKQNTEWCEQLYNPRHGNNIHNFELETIQKAGIFLASKHNVKGVVFSKGKLYSKPKLSSTGVELVKSTTPALAREIQMDIILDLMYNYDEDDKQNYIMLLNQKITEYRRKFYKAPIESISQSVSIGAYKKYTIDDTNKLILAPRCPVSVQSIARFNYLAHKNGEDQKKMYSGKIKYYNIRLDAKNTGYFGYPAGELPSWAPPMDKNTQWQKNVIDPINRFLTTMKLPLLNASENQQLMLF